MIRINICIDIIKLQCVFSRFDYANIFLNCDWLIFDLFLTLHVCLSTPPIFTRFLLADDSVFVFEWGHKNKQTCTHK